MSGEGCILHMKIGYDPRRERNNKHNNDNARHCKTLQDKASQDKPRQWMTSSRVTQKKNKLIPTTTPERDKSIARACTLHYKTYRIGTIEISCVTVSQPMSYKKKEKKHSLPAIGARGGNRRYYQSP